MGVSNHARRRKRLNRRERQWDRRLALQTQQALTPQPGWGDTLQLLTERIRLVLRAPLDRLQSAKAGVWTFGGEVPNGDL